MLKMMYNSKISLFISAIVMIAIMTGCSGSEKIMTPGGENKSEKTLGELHNEVLKTYLIICYKDGLFKEDYGERGLKVSWDDMRSTMTEAYNLIMKRNNLAYRVTEEDVEVKMQAIKKMAEDGVVNFFDPESVTPAKLRIAVTKGYLKPGVGKVAKAVERELSPHQIYAAEIEKDPEVEVFKKSMELWKEVQTPPVVGKDEDEEEDDWWDDWWHKLRHWWHKHEPQIRTVYVATCDAGGGFIGAGIGNLGGCLLGTAIGSAAGTAAWPPPDSE